MDQKKLRIWTLFKQCVLPVLVCRLFINFTNLKDFTVLNSKLVQVEMKAGAKIHQKNYNCFFSARLAPDIIWVTLLQYYKTELRKHNIAEQKVI